MGKPPGHVMHLPASYKQTAVDLSVLIAIECFFLAYFDPQLLFSLTTTTGGDTASHYYTAKYLRDYLLPHGKLIGWLQGNYAGFPLFQFYFPLPFVFMAVLSWVMPLQIAFKIGSVIGTFLMPVCAYLALRIMRFEFPAPILGALSTLPFLFMEANSMWGGNLPSTMAGEFAYTLGFALTLLFVGVLYRGITTGTGVIACAVLEALNGFAHGYTLLFAGTLSLYFLITTDNFIAKFKYLFKVHVLAFCLMGLWILPLLLHMPFTTRYNHVWFISSLSEVFPEILLPLIGAALLGRAADALAFVHAYWKRRRAGGDAASKAASWNGIDPRIIYLWFGLFTAVGFYLVANRIHVVDIRFLPFVQIFLMIIGAVEIGRAVKGIWGRTLVPVIMALAVFLWVDQHSVSIRNWIEWNYSGFENKQNWPAFSGVNRRIAGGVGDPRVVYEHNDAHNDMGTLRAFESIPLFSGRSTLEGLYMQSSISTPFVFYIQSEISKQISCPLPDYGCAVLNLKNGIEHLKLFNVREFIVRSPEVKREIAKFPEFKFVNTFGPLDLYELTVNENRYVAPLKVEPVLYETRDWKTAAYEWFKKLEVIDIPLVFTERATPADGARFKTIVRDEDMNRLPRIPIAGACRVEEKIEEETIRFKTSCPNRPHLIKISYHPNWKAEGAARVYQASPSFMIVYPDRGEVTLRFSRTGVEYAGIFLSLMALAVVGLNGPYWRNNPVNRFIHRSGEAAGSAVRAALNQSAFFVRARRYAQQHRRRILTLTMTSLFVLTAAFVVLYKKTDPGMLYNEGLHDFNKQRYAEARRAFEKVVRDYPLTASAVNSAYYWAITYFREGDFQKTIELFEKLLALYPESPWAPEAHYHIAISLANLGRTDEARDRYRRVVEGYPASQWAGFARERLTELAAHKPGPEEGADRLFTQAMRLFDAGELDGARDRFRAVVKQYPKSKLAESAGYFIAICYFKQDRFQDVIREFQSFVSAHPGSDYAAEAYFHVGLSRQRLNQTARARAVFEKIIRDYPSSRWAGYSRDALKAAGFKPAQAEMRP